jgi:S-formylglutathione hydrolase FrmB
MRALRCVAATTAVGCLALAGCTSATRPSAGHRPSTPSSAISTARRVHGPVVRALSPGSVEHRAIPGGPSHFHARDAEIYLPPVAASHPRRRLPVLELLHGEPGGPTDWIRKGDLAAVANAFASSRHGQAPIVVMPDVNGSRHGDTECIRTPGGANVERYLADVVPAWIAAHLPAAADHREWSVAGNSEGGTCAAMLALRHSTTFESFGDFSGLQHLTLGKRDNRALTTRVLFGGSKRDYDVHDPPWLLAHRGSGLHLVAWYECGGKDRTVSHDQADMVADTRRAGIPLRAVVVPGGHEWPVWTDALARLLTWFWARAGE